ncbi:MAG TPA: ABC transporter permease [Thermoanaerobaculia bacterium]|nr:ABC transporter permease [Thermoanaerobaculia bacterium]
MLGVVIGVAAVVTAVAIGAGASASVQERMQALGSNFIVIIPEQVVVQGARVETQRSRLTIEDAEAIRRECDAVAYVSPSARTTAQVVSAEGNWGTSINGMGVDFPFIRRWNVEQGRFFTDADVRSAALVCVLGATVADNIFRDLDPVGATVRIRNVPFRVVGLLERKGGSIGGNDHDDLVVVPYTTLMRRLTGSSRPGSLVASAISDRHVEEAMQQIDALLRQRHRLPPDGPADFRLRAQTEIMEASAEQARTMANLILAIAAVSLVIGGVGIMNIMLVSVTERTREIGIRLAVGAKGRHVLVQFLFEAVTLSIAGGLTGVLFGVGAAVALGKAAGWPIVISPASILIAFLVAGSVGIFFGFYPARKASRLDPIDALRYE